MPHIRYRDFRFTPDTHAVIQLAAGICREYEAQGFILTLRQLYYQFVARGHLPNTDRDYKRLGEIVNRARQAGLLDWDSIEDRTRSLRQLSCWNSPKDILKAVSEQFRYDWWDSQETRVEVWIEKDALVGVIEPVCNEFRVPFFACRGNNSQSEQWRAGRRFLEYCERGQSVVVLHLGDHDPNGIDMTRDNAVRLALFSEEADVEVRRIALNMDQVRHYNPPPNPVKFTDSRAQGYAALFGHQSWELDALEPQVISDLLRGEFEGLIDESAWQTAGAKEEAARKRLRGLSSRWREE